METTESRVVIQGLLEKKGHGGVFFNTWARRFFVVTEDGKLTYYSGERKAKKGTFTLLKDSSVVGSPKDFYFSIRDIISERATRKISLDLRTDSAEERKAWMKAINGAIQGGVSMQLLSVDQVALLLKAVKLDKYIESFIDSHITGNKLLYCLTHKELKGLGPDMDITSFNILRAAVREYTPSGVPTALLEEAQLQLQEQEQRRHDTHQDEENACRREEVNRCFKQNCYNDNFLVVLFCCC